MISSAEGSGTDVGGLADFAVTVIYYCRERLALLLFCFRELVSVRVWGACRSRAGWRPDIQAATAAYK